MRTTNLRITPALGAALVAEAVLVSSAFAWVAIYSHLLNPGHDVAFYRAYAQSASPFVSLALGIPVFFLVCRYVAGAKPIQALAVFAIYCAIEIPILLYADTSAIPSWFPFVNFPCKFLGCYLGGCTTPKRASA